MIKICQTLWVNDKNILKDNFGWYTAQHHIMAWALSCIKLKQLYPVVNLHTDKKGIALFKNELNFPYSNVYNDYTDLDCPPNLWALPKLLTYVKQKSPFLHVDGDVFVWKTFDKKLLSAELIAQNLERGTVYYKNSFLPLIEKLRYIPKHLKQNLISNNLRSYNMGIIGGSDNTFFDRYVSEAIKFIDTNKEVFANINVNILFEQILFFSLTALEEKKVACLFDIVFNDMGYSKAKMASFSNVNQLGYLHIIGTFKKDKEICDWIARHLYHENEELYLRIVSLFKEKHYFYSTKIKKIHPQIPSSKKVKFSFYKTRDFLKHLGSDIDDYSNLQTKKDVENSENVFLKDLFKYEQKLANIFSKFNKIEASILKQYETTSLSSIFFLSNDRESQFKTIFQRNVSLQIIYSAFDWTTLQISNEAYVNIRSSKNKDIIIGIVPQLFFQGYKEVILDQVCVNLILLAEHKITYQQLVRLAQNFFPQSNLKKEDKSFDELMLLKMEFLITNKILFSVS